jgi:hypothetical protein
MGFQELRHHKIKKGSNGLQKIFFEVRAMALKFQIPNSKSEMPNANPDVIPSIQVQVGEAAQRCIGSGIWNLELSNAVWCLFHVCA